MASGFGDVLPGFTNGLREDAKDGSSGSAGVIPSFVCHHLKRGLPQFYAPIYQPFIA